MKKHRLIKGVRKAKNSKGELRIKSQARCLCGQWTFTFRANTDTEESRMWQSFHNHEFDANRKS